MKCLQMFAILFVSLVKSNSRLVQFWMSQFDVLLNLKSMETFPHEPIKIQMTSFPTNEEVESDIISLNRVERDW